MNRATRHSKVWHLILEGRLGFGIIGFIIGLRLLGFLQILELLTLDKFQQISPAEPTDSRITLIGIDQSYVKNNGGDSLEYADLAELVEAVLSHQPAIVGVDLVEDDLSGEGKKRLTQLFENNNNLLTVEKIRPPLIPPMAGLSNTTLTDKVGFNDFSLDNDGNVRRMFLGWTPTSPAGAPFRKSFALMLAEQYFNEIHKIEIENGDRDEWAMRFDDVEIPRLAPISGGYRKESSIYGIQTLINFRGGLISAGKNPKPFKVLLASELAKNDLDEKDFSEKIIIIGSLSYSKVSSFYAATPLQLAYNVEALSGLELQAHATSQITSAVLDNRPLIWVLNAPWEYTLIIAFGLVGIGLKRALRSTLDSFFLLLAISALFSLTSYSFLVLGGLWLPVVPAMLALIINGFINITIAQSENSWQILVQERAEALALLKLERQRTIEHAFDTIHNGPLQTLANLLRLIRDDQISTHDIGYELTKLNQEIREIGESLKQDSISDDNLYIQVRKSKLDLRMPLHELFYEIYRETLERPFPGFQNLNIQARSFEPVTPDTLAIEHKRKLCRFFEETLCNVGKHAIGATKLTVTGKVITNIYHLRITDNGLGFNSHAHRKGRGTKIARDLETKLKGKFIQKNNYPRGVFCEFKWPLS